MRKCKQRIRALMCGIVCTAALAFPQAGYASVMSAGTPEKSNRLQAVSVIREEQDTELSGTESLPSDESDHSAGNTAEEVLTAAETDETGENAGGTADSDSDGIVTESSVSVSGSGTADSKNTGTVTDSGEMVPDSTGTSGDDGENSTDSADTAAAADVDTDSAVAGTAEETESEGTTEEENTAGETKPGKTAEEESTAEETKPAETTEEENTAEETKPEETAEKGSTSEETKPGETAEEESTAEESTAEDTSADKTEHLFRIYTDEETAAEGDELASSAMAFQSGPRRAAAASSAKVTASQIVAQALSRLGAGYSQANRLGPDYYDCSGLLYSCFTSLGITQNVPDTTAGWDQLCSGLDIGSVVTFSGSGGSISYQLTAKNTDVLSNPAAFSTPGTIMIFINPGASSGHAAISLGSIPRQDSGYDPNTNASAIVTATETYLKNLLSSTYGVSMSLLNGTNRVSGNPNVWTDARYLGTDMNRGADGYSGPYNSIYRVDALNTRFGVSVNNLTTGKSGNNVRYVLVPYTEPEKGNLSVSKKGKYTGTAAAGAVFDLYADQACTSLIGEYKTDSNGSFQAAGLNAGTYYLKEKSAPDGFTPDTSTVWTVTVEKDSTAAQQVTNEEWSGTLRVLKTDAADGTAIAGGSFTLQEWSGAAGNYQDVGILTNEGGGVHQVTSYTVRSTGKTVSGGRIYYTPDNAGKFRVVETANPEGYTGSFSAEVTISKADQKFSFNAENTPNPGKIEIRKQGLDEETGKTAPLAGAVFGIYSSLNEAQNAKETSGQAVAILTTGEDGCAVSDALPAGHYWVRELTAPEGYVVSTKIYGGQDGLKIGAAVESVTVTADENVKPKPKYVYIHKQDSGSGAAVTGAVLILSNAAGDQVDTWTTAEEPHRLKNLPDGVYTLTETEAPAEQGYVKAAPVTFTIRDGLVDGTGENVVMEDDYTKLDISKTDITTGEELPGAHLVLKDADGNVVDDFVSTDQPHRIERIAPGRYTLTETSAPEGYVISETAAFEVKSTGEVQKVTMKDDYTKLDISKTDITTGEELPGAHLAILDQDGNTVEEFVSGDQPHRIERIAPGSYTLVETSAPDGYVITEAVKFEVVQTADVQKVEMKNDYTKLDISKTDITTGEELPGAHLAILDQDGNTVEEFVSGSEPHRIERIAPGSYTLIETSAPDGYVITEAVKFEVGQTADVQKVEMKNDYTKLDISKTDITTGEELPGAHLAILDQDGNTVEEFVSGSEPHRIERIAPGSYTLVETSAPDGYVITEAVKFDVEQIADIQKVEMKNDYTKLDISKTDITTGEELPGAHLAILDQDGNTVEEFVSGSEPHRIERIAPGSYTLIETSAPDGYVITEAVKFDVEQIADIQKVEMKDDYTKLDISKTDITTGEELPGAHLVLKDADGNVVDDFLSTDQPHRIERIAPGTYTLTETSAPEGYIIAEAVAFDVEQIADIQKVEMKNDYTKLDISKTDITTGEELPGAHLVLKDADGNVVEDFISTDQPHRIERIAPGSYTLTETAAPSGYLESASVAFTVTATGEIQKVSMKDAPVPETPSPQNQVKVLGIADSSPVIGAALIGGGVLLLAALVFAVRKFFDRNK